jgi:hypothetical protein
MLLRAWAPALLWALLILVLCLMPGRTLPQWDWADLFSLDKPVHAVLFGVLTVLLGHGFKRTERTGPILAWSVLLSVGYGLATEAMQQLQALGRHGDVNDAIANTVGALAGAIHLRHRWNKERSAGSAKVA